MLKPIIDINNFKLLSHIWKKYYKRPKDRAKLLSWFNFK
jgi:hypothetical protein